MDMKNWPILLPIALLLGGLSWWGISTWSSPNGGDSNVEESPGAKATGPAKAGGKAPVGAKVSTPDKATPGKSFQLPTGPTWNARNPWYDTRGIGRRTRPPAKGAVHFPDGTWLPILNGVENAPPYPGFSREYPYAPVTQIVTDDKGIQWYIHADGTRSAPQNMQYAEKGKDMGTRPGWAVGNPYDKKPVVGPDGKIRYEPRKPPKPVIRTSSGG